MNLRLLLAAGLCAATLLPAGAAPKDCITVAVLSLNDFHGAFIRDARKGIPGAAAIWQTVDSLKRVYPYHVTVAAGDNFGGSYFSTATQSRLLPVFFNDLGIRISAVGNHEFDNGTAWLAQKWAGSDMLPRGWELTYVCANVANASGRCPSYMQPFATEEIKLPSGRSITVAFVGLITSSTPLQTRRANTAGLSFDGRYDAVTATLSRRPEYAAVDSADVRILLTHIGTKMSGGSPAWHDADSARIAAFADPRFHAEAVRCGDEFIGLLYWWQGPSFRYVEHLAIRPDLRGRNLGSALFESFCRGERVILEIDPPRDEISTRRLGFYRRLGFHDSPLPYVHPSYSRPFEPHRLVLMGYPAPLEQEEARRLADFVRRVVLHYTEHRQPTLPRIP